MADVRTRVTIAMTDLAREMRGLDPALDDGSLTTIARYLYLNQYRWVHELLERDTHNAATVLDWGTGFGHFAYVQRRLGRSVTAYTLEPTDYNRYNEMLAALAVKGGFPVIIGDHPVRIPLPSESFDVVVSCGVLEHVREFGGDEVGSLKEIRRVLREGGRFYCLHFPNRHSWIELTNRVLRRPHHLRTYTLRDLDELAMASGFSVVRRRRYGFIPKIEFARRLGRLADASPLVHSYYLLDRILSSVLPFLAQNLFFVLKKPSG